MKTKKLNNMEKFKQIALEFFNRQKEFKKAQVEFEELKVEFYSEMIKLFEAKQEDNSIVFSDSFVDGSLKVKKIQKSNVVFDANKLEKNLGKEIAKDVIIKKYEITDMFGLIAYLKECDVDPKIFTSFISVTKSVDVKELDRLEELGKINIEQLNGCYTVKKQNPYFTVGIEK